MLSIGCSRLEPFYKLMLVTNRQNTPLADYLQFIKHCAHAGITAVQLREKNQTPAFLLMFAEALKAILDPLKIPLIINDSLELALNANAHGVHLGQSDGCPSIARQCLGHDKIIGISIDSIEDLTKANHLPIDYVGIGAIFTSPTKKNVTTTWGLKGLQQLSSQSKHPIIAIGGINVLNAKEVLLSGADGIAVISALHDTDNPIKVTENLRHIIDKERYLEGASHDL